MRVGLIDVDGHNFPNLALMKISAYYKSKGDTVEWYVPFEEKYDIVYKSKVFSFTPDYDEIINADKVIKGGTGYAINLVGNREFYDKSKDLSLPTEIEKQYPDYTIYPQIKETAYGFMTRGCPRGCNFCIVGNKEGFRSYKVADLSDFWSGQKNIVLMDPNLLACAEREEIINELIASGANVDFNQGLDIRLMTEDLAAKIAQIKMKEIHFAWDKYNDRDIILPKLEMFRAYSPKKRGHNAIVYVIVNFDTTLEQDLERIYTLRGMGYWAYVMIYDKQHCAPIYRDLQRWCNNRFIFGAVPRFEDYKKYNQAKNQKIKRYIKNN